MIIAAYAGTGKSTFAARFENAADVASMPRSRILLPKKTEGESEQEKGRIDLLADPLYPDNYIIDILKAERKYDYVLIPTSMNVVRRLREEYGRKVVLCYPAGGLKEEYRERFAARGNGEDFLSLFIGMWDDFLKPVREYRDAAHIVMETGEYLTDLKDRLDHEFLRDETRPVPDEAVAGLEQRVQSRRHHYALWLSYCFWYRIPDILDPDERFFLANLSRKTYGGLFIVPVSEADKLLTPEEVITDDKQRVLKYLEQRYGWSILPCAAEKEG